MLEVDDSEKRKLLHEETTGKIIGAAFEVHDQLGYGFLERVYQRALQVELLRSRATAELEKRISVHYKGAVVGDYDIDVPVDCMGDDIDLRVGNEKIRQDLAHRELHGGHARRAANRAHRFGQAMPNCVFGEFGVARGERRAALHDL